MNDLNRAVRQALKGCPVTLRALAREARVPHVTLSHIQNGKRNATLDVARAVADALDRIGEKSKRGAATVRRSLTNQRGEEK